MSQSQSSPSQFQSVFPPPYIRVVAIALIRQDDRILVAEGYDKTSQSTFYRALGGGVDFGETSLDGLKREFQEELQAELTNLRYLGCLENLFTCYGNPGHEILQVYEAEFVDRAFYEAETLTFNEGDRQKTATWISIDEFKSGNRHLVPEAFLQYL